MSGPVTGKCLCGSVAIAAEPQAGGLSESGLGACHCGMCRRWTSCTFLEFTAKQGSVSVEGPVKVFQSSEWAERAFCERCGSALWYRLTGDGPEAGRYQLSAGLFENAGDMSLTLEVFIDRKPDGYAFAGERKTLTEADILAMYAQDQN